MILITSLVLNEHTFYNFQSEKTIKYAAGVFSPDPASGAYSASSDHLAGLEGHAFLPVSPPGCDMRKSHAYIFQYISRIDF